MPKEAPKDNLSLALNTALEQDFVSPLTSIRGALEIIRDFPDLPDEERLRFLDNALQDCARLEQGVKQLAATVYTHASPETSQQPQTPGVKLDSAYTNRFCFIEELQVAEIDFSNFVFTSSQVVNDFYDLVDQSIEASGQRWYIVVNYYKCRIWPEAWVAFAHRGKKVNVSYSLGTMRYINADEEDKDPAPFDVPDMFASREDALAQVEALRNASGGN
jgi:hypothetical protein